MKDDLKLVRIPKSKPAAMKRPSKGKPVSGHKGGKVKGY